MKRKKISKRIIVITIVTLVILSVPTGLWLFPEKEIQEYTTAPVQKIDLVQTVSEVGSVKSSKEIELNFGQSGKLDNLSVKTGDEVKKGQLLAELDYKTLLIKKSEAESNLGAARASLQKVISGASREDIAVSEARAKAAKNNYYAALSTLEKTESKVEDSIAQAEKTLNDLKSSDPYTVTSYEQAVSSAAKDLENTKLVYGNSINNKKESLISTVNSKLSAANTSLDEVDIILSNSDIEDYLSSKDTSYLASARDGYDEAEILLSNAYSSLALVGEDSNDSNVNSSASDALIALNKTADTLNLCFNVLENSSLSQTVSDAYKTAISAEITTISAAITALETAIQNFNDAKLTYDSYVSSAEETLKQAQVALEDAILAAENSLSTARTAGDKELASAEASVTSAKESWDVAESELAKLKAPARREDINLEQSKVKQAQASLDLVVKQLEDSLIKSPIDGKVTDIEYEVGEQVSQSMAVISLLAQNSFEIEVDISESDIAKIKVGNEAEITLDAFGEDKVFAGIVSFIEPAETVIQDVIYYKVKIEFKDQPEMIDEIKSGMTANISITSNIKKGVLVVPSRAILEKDGRKYIRVWVKGKVQEHEAEVGLRGDGGYVEIFNDVKEGDEVVTYSKEMKKRLFRYQ